eukprot:1412777-Rhodomonas_salina.1
MGSVGNVSGRQNTVDSMTSVRERERESRELDAWLSRRGSESWACDGPLLRAVWARLRAGRVCVGREGF